MTAALNPLRLQRFCLCVVVLLLSCVRAVAGQTLTEPAAGEPVYVLFTCDVESLRDGDPERDIWGKIGDEYHGITRMMDIFEQYGRKLTFFVNVYEVGDYGEEEMREICRAIVDRGHDIQLHTHPSSLFPEYPTMQSADYEKQKEILLLGKQLLSDLSGSQIIAHRAGGFWADYNTLSALRDTGFRLDSSMNHAWPSCGLNTPVLTINRARVAHGILEIPVTVYAELHFDKLRRLRHLDVESSSFAEFEKVFDAAVEYNIPTVVVMLHSFSFTRFGRINHKVEEKLAALLAHTNRDERLQATTFSDLYELYSTNPQVLEGNDFIPTTGLFLTYLRAWQRLDEGYKNVVFALSPVAFIFCFLGVTVYVRKRFSRNRGH